MSRMRSLMGGMALLMLALSLSSFAQAPYSVKENYRKIEYRIPMRDGVKLFTSVYVPKDQTRKYPFIMSRTPYSVAPYGAEAIRGALGPSPLFAPEGFIFVYQDVRGRNMSEGEFMWMRPYKPKKAGPTDTDETTDTWDTIEFLLKEIPNNNGRFGQWGISYPGHYSAQSLIDPHPAMKAVSPQAPMADNWLGDDMHHNGAFFLPHAFNFIINFGRPRKGPEQQGGPRFDHGTNDGYQFFLEMGALSNAQKYMKNEIRLWDEWMAHGDYDAYWQAQNVPQHLKKVTPAVMTVGGWFDAEDVQGPLWIYREIEKNNPKAWNVLVQGPWCHGCWARGTGEKLGGVSFGSPTSQFYRDNIEFPFFMHFLKDKGEMKLPEAYVFETGSNVWKTYESWPPKNTETRSLYLHADGKLAFAPPASGAAYDEYVSDPARPVPFLKDPAINMRYEYMTDDQRFSANRTDVLVYQTDVLTEDMTLAGPLNAELFVSTTGTDSDYVVKLIDVFPAKANDPMDRYQMLVRGEPMRAKYRNSWSKPEPMKPNQVTKVPFALPDINHTFKKGHRIMIHLQSSWFPLVDRNPQKFLNIYAAKDEDFQKATQRVYHSAKAPSNLKALVVK
ncbi:MAG: CocE/NonD family hydrolase [Blastocatellia bacterium]|nr:CocE/NonD family hydrolase [Blastocatellia bacterium]